MLLIATVWISSLTSHSFTTPCVYMYTKKELECKDGIFMATKNKKSHASRAFDALSHLLTPFLRLVSCGTNTKHFMVNWSELPIGQQRDNWNSATQLKTGTKGTHFSCVCVKHWWQQYYRFQETTKFGCTYMACKITVPFYSTDMCINLRYFQCTPMQ